MAIYKRAQIVIPCISFTYLFPNVEMLCFDLENLDDVGVLQLREEYGRMVLLLFYPYRIEDDLRLEGSY